MSSAGGLAFGTLGPLEARAGGQLLRLGSTQLRTVLAALLADANVVVPVDRLVEALWGDEPPTSAASSVQKLVYRLRGLLGPGAEDVLVTHPPGYVVRVGPASYDASRFESLVTDAQDALGEHDSARASTRLDEALRLWRGPAFGEFAFADFARAEAARLEELRWVATEVRIEARLSTGAHEELVGELEGLVGEAPFRERLWGDLMVALYRSGRQAEALRAYGRVRNLLGEELGIEPSAALRELEAAMVLQQPELDWADVTSGDGVLNADHTGNARTGNLALPLNSFVGRERELTAVAHALRESRLVTLTGVGGVGKTRLAIQVAANEHEEFPDGTWLCELAVAGDPDAMVQVVAAALGVQTRSGITIAEAIREFLHSKRLLLVFDNCEHLLDAAASFVEFVLHESPHLRILATSREGLSVDGERIWALRSLPLPEARAEFDDLVSSDAARLFEDRARAVQSSFALDASTASAVGELCRRLDGVPLAIELAAARVVAMTPGEIAARLDERFRLLTGGRRTAVDRHQTLRATVDWSYSLLSPTERLVFARLGVFPGTFSGSAAEAITSGAGVEEWDVVDALGSLVAKSMVVTDHAHDTTRYSLLETLRAYARERLDEIDDADTWRLRHAEHYAAFAERAGPLLEGRDELAWHGHVRAELDNLRGAFGWSLDSTAAHTELGLRIVAALAYEGLLDMTSGVSSWAERAIPLTGATTPGRRTAVLGAAAMQAMYVGDYQRAEALALDALRDGLPVDCPCPSPAYTALAVAQLVKGRPDESVRVLRDGLDQLQKLGADSFKISEFQSRLSIFATYSGDFAGARTEAREGLRLAHQIGNPSATASALVATGVALIRVDPAAALVALEDYIALARAGAQKTNLGIAFGDVGLLKARAGDRVGALIAARDGAEYSHRTGNRATFGGTLSRTRHTLVALESWEPAAVLTGALTAGALAGSDGQAGVTAELRDRVEALAAIRTALAPGVLEDAIARGEAMTYDEVAEYTLGELDRLLAEARAA